MNYDPAVTLEGWLLDHTFTFLHLPLTNDPECDSCGVLLVDLFASLSLDAVISLQLLEYSQVDNFLELGLSGLIPTLCIDPCPVGSKPSELLGKQYFLGFSA